jgi:hypothetical protein
MQRPDGPASRVQAPAAPRFWAAKKFKELYLADRGRGFPHLSATCSTFFCQRDTTHPRTRRRTAVHGSHGAEPSRRPHPRWLMRGPICGQREKVRERRERGKMSWEEEEGLTCGEGVRQRQIRRPVQAPAAPPSSPLLASLSPYPRLCGSSLSHPRPHLWGQ